MGVLRISLFGRLDVRHGQDALAGLQARRVQELFCYLLLYRDRPHRREGLASLLWDERHTESPSRCLRKALWQLRSALDSQSELLSERVLRVEPDWIQFNPQADVWIDVAQFEQAFRDVQHIQGVDLDAQSIQWLQDAVRLYRGGLQESWYQDWYLYERARFQHLYLILLDKLMEHSEAYGRFAAGLAYGTLILDCERARERTHRRLMRLHYQAGDRTAALRQYEMCVSALDEELGVGPGRRTEALCRRIRFDRPDSTDLNQAGSGGDPLVPSSPQTLLPRLKEIHGLLAEIQHGIVLDIQAAELAMRSQD